MNTTPQHKKPRSGRVALLGALVVAITAPPAIRADEPEPLFAVVRDAVAAGKTRNTPVHGFHDPKRTFAELPAGKLLIGFECGLGKFIDSDVVYALRAIYRSPDGVSVGPEHGRFPTHGAGQMPSRVERTLRLQAPRGYAVGAVTMRSGLNVNGLALTYMKLRGPRLEPHETRVSEWIGDRETGSEAFLGGDGALVVGIVGSQDETHIQSLGLIAVETPPAALAPPDALDPPDEEDARPPRKAPKAGRRGKTWLPFAVFGLVTGAGLFASRAFLHAKKRRAAVQRASEDSPVEIVPPSPNGIRAGWPARRRKES